MENKIMGLDKTFFLRPEPGFIKFAHIFLQKCGIEFNHFPTPPPPLHSVEFNLLQISL